MSSFIGGRYTLDSISLADLSPSQTRWPVMVEAGHLWPSRKERRLACTILGSDTPAMHRSAWKGNSAKYACPILHRAPATAPRIAPKRPSAPVR